MDVGGSLRGVTVRLGGHPARKYMRPVFLVVGRYRTRGAGRRIVSSGLCIAGRQPALCGAWRFFEDPTLILPRRLPRYPF
jgi:hypothetical protein